MAMARRPQRPPKSPQHAMHRTTGFLIARDTAALAVLEIHHCDTDMSDATDRDRAHCPDAK